MSAPGPLVTLLRHGQTEWSASGRHTGRTDLDLTVDGERQAVAAGGALAGLHFGAVLCSPLLRARRTAELAGFASFDIEADLHEWDYGDFEGLTTPEIRERHPGWEIWRGPWPGGETAADVAHRADRVIARVLEHPPGSRVALVAHGHLLRVLVARWIEEPPAAGRRFALDTASVSELGWEHQDRVVHRWNQTSA